MQNWKIERMSRDAIEKWLKAIDLLLNHYLGLQKLGDAPCPFCFAECVNCLWKIIEGIDCEDFKIMLYPTSRYSLSASALRRNLRYKKWKLARISQLGNWKRIMKVELGKKTRQEAAP